MTQREMLAKRVEEILDKQVMTQKLGERDAPNLLMGGSLALSKMGAGGIKDFLAQLARGVPLVYLLGKLAMGGCNSCEGGEMLAAGPMGGVITEKTKMGQQIYLDFMLKEKANGLSHKEALAAWKAHKASKGKSAIKVTLKPSSGSVTYTADTFRPTKIGKKLRRKFKTADPEAERCMKYLGLEHDEGMDSEMAQQIGDEMVSGLKEQEAMPAPVVSVLSDEQIKKLQDEDADENYWNRYEEEAIGSGKPKPKRKGKPLTAEHRAKLDSGRAQYLHFMEVVKGKGMTHKEALELYRKLKAERGGKWYNDFMKGFMSVVKPAAKLLPTILPMIL